MVDRMDPETVAREIGAYQRLNILAGRTAITILPVGRRIRLAVGHVAPITGEGDDLAAAVAVVYAQVFRDPRADEDPGT